MRPHAALLRQSGQRPVFLLCTDIYSGYTIWSALNLNFGFKLGKKTGRINKISQRRIVWIGMKVVSSQLIFRTLKPAGGEVFRLAGSLCTEIWHRGHVGKRFEFF